MKLSAGRLGFILAAAVLVVGAIVTLSRSHDRRAAAKPAGTQIRTNTNNQPAEPQPPNRHKRAKSQADSRPAGKVSLDKLLTKASGFLEAYYLILPTDSRSSRRSRLSPFVTRQILSKIDVGMGEGSAANQARIRLGLTQSGRTDNRQQSLEPAYGQTRAYVLTVPVIVSVRRRNGKTINRFRVQTVSKWSFTKGHWVLVDFNEGGETG